jgi:hypothetical protein
VVQKEVLSKVRSDRLKVFVIWLPMVEGDSRDVAVEAAGLISDPRASHFWDPRREMAAALGKAVGPRDAKEPRPVWDFYAVFGPSANWNRSIPIPDDWMHQLDGFDPKRRLDGEKLRESVTNRVRAISH